MQEMILKKIKVGDSPGLSVREVTGVITLEDILEEMIKAEIVDEHDTFVANDSMQRVNKVPCLCTPPFCQHACMRVQTWRTEPCHVTHMSKTATRDPLSQPICVSMYDGLWR